VGESEFEEIPKGAEGRGGRHVCTDEEIVMTGSAGSDLFIFAVLILTGGYALIVHVFAVADVADSRNEHEYIHQPGEPRRDDPRDHPRRTGRA
jgi:hypothetical protein